jgi:hypothetical protein
VILKGVDSIQAAVGGTKTATYRMVEASTHSELLAMLADFATDAPGIPKSILQGGGRTFVVLLKPGNAVVFDVTSIVGAAGEAAEAAAKEIAENPRQAATAAAAAAAKVESNAARVLGTAEVGVHGPGKAAGSLFEEFGVTPGRGLNLDVPSDPEGRSHITYAFKNSSGEVVYVGRAGGPGTPRKVLADRISKGHDHFTEGLTAEVVDVQGSKLASQGAEEVFVQGYREQGANLTNIDEPLSYKNSERIQHSLKKIEAYIEDLEQRGLR